jgi:hypothetical protein
MIQKQEQVIAQALQEVLVGFQQSAIFRHMINLWNPGRAVDPTLNGSMKTKLTRKEQFSVVLGLKFQHFASLDSKFDHAMEAVAD